MDKHALSPGLQPLLVVMQCPNSNDIVFTNVVIPMIFVSRWVFFKHPPRKRRKSLSRHSGHRGRRNFQISITLFRQDREVFFPTPFGLSWQMAFLIRLQGIGRVCSSHLLQEKSFSPGETQSTKRRHMSNYVNLIDCIPLNVWPMASDVARFKPCPGVFPSHKIHAWLAGCSPHVENTRRYWK